ncbi:AI-2E family transporter [Ahniella affigens]|uniref:AI-2E family transporter n=1 Tax=Ahniella affigens TaxID=2021234 RepID=A0A2P1PXS1_9GAMM|nr:AI-2E family transporter [Ahniella affigens]AVP99638.1 AI-2E family transporter [Ahniella affigens]
MFVDQRTWLWLASAVLMAVLLYLLAPVLTPFAVSALLAYLSDPLVDRLERRFSRTTSVVIVFAGLLLLAASLLAIVIPTLFHQAQDLPELFHFLEGWLNGTALPYLRNEFGLNIDALSPGQIFESAKAHLQDIGKIAKTIFASVGKGSAFLLTWAANLVLIPVLTFYLLRDWDVLVNRVYELLPRPIAPTAAKLVRESDEVLGAFLRGQVSVMLALGLLYGLGLSICGIRFGLLIGFAAGMLSFVPYLGPALGIVAGALAALASPGDPWINLLLVAIVFGSGQMIESFVLTPRLVGDKIGLHPVAVIFAVMAGGALFGFFGVLLALPVAAVILVVLKHAHERYLQSDLYGATPNASTADLATAAGTDRNTDTSAPSAPASNESQLS